MTHELHVLHVSSLESLGRPMASCIRNFIEIVVGLGTEITSMEISVPPGEGSLRSLVPSREGISPFPQGKGSLMP